MNSSVDHLKQIPPTSNPLRTALQSAVAEPHQLLEQIPLMQGYASGSASDKEYIAVTRAMLAFWGSRAPASHHLPEAYHEFFESYLEALRGDVGLHMPVESIETVDELAFYYVLLGSGLGAKVILRNNVDSGFSKRNLLHLAQHSTPLWKDFIHSHLVAVPQERAARVKKDSRILFDNLLNKIQKIA